MGSTEAEQPGARGDAYLFDMTPEELRAKSSAGVAAWNARDLEGFFSGFREDVVYHAKPGDDLRGVAALRERYALALQFCPDLTIAIEVLVVGDDGRSMASVQTESGTMVDGKPFGFRGMVFLAFDEAGLIEEMWEMTAPLA